MTVLVNRFLSIQYGILRQAGKRMLLYEHQQLSNSKGLHAWNGCGQDFGACLTSSQFTAYPKPASSCYVSLSLRKHLLSLKRFLAFLNRDGMCLDAAMVWAPALLGALGPGASTVTKKHHLCRNDQSPFDRPEIGHQLDRLRKQWWAISKMHMLLLKYRIRIHKSFYYECWTACLAGKCHQLGLWTRAGFHRVSWLSEEGGHQLFPLPPYSPEYHPIEKTWVHMKKHLRKVLPNCATFLEVFLS